MAATRRLRIVLLLAALAGMAAPRAGAADFSDPDWPCIQRKVPHLAPAQMWSGPALGDPLPDWRADPAVARLAPVLAARRTPEPEVERLVAEFAAAAGADRPARLTLLFAGAFALIDAERGEIIGGIARYARKQAALAARLDTTRDQVAALAARPDRSLDDEDRLEELQDQLAWDTRIFKERQQSLTYVCESPVILESRAFMLAKAIMAHLDPP